MVDFKRGTDFFSKKKWEFRLGKMLWMGGFCGFSVDFPSGFRRLHDRVQGRIDDPYMNSGEPMVSCGVFLVKLHILDAVKIIYHSLLNFLFCMHFWRNIIMWAQGVAPQRGVLAKSPPPRSSFCGIPIISGKALAAKVRRPEGCLEKHMAKGIFVVSDLGFFQWPFCLFVVMKNMPSPKKGPNDSLVLKDLLP